MRPRPGLIIAIIVLILGAVYTARVVRQGKEQQQREDLARRVFNLAPEEIRSITIERPPSRIRLERGEDGWVLLEPVRSATDSETVNEMLRLITAGEILSTVEPDAASVDRYGLGPLGIRLIVAATGGDSTIEVGLEAPTMDGAYIRRAGEKDVLLAGSGLRDVARVDPALLRERMMMSGADSATRLVVISASGRVAAVRGEAGWELEFPFSFPADDLKIEELLGAMGRLRLQAPEGAPPAPPQAGIDPPRIEVRCITKGGERVVYVGGPADERRVWVRREGDDRLLLAETGGLSLLGKEPTAWCSTRPARIDRYQVTRLDLRIGDRTLSARKSDEGWVLDDGPSVDEQRMLRLLAALFDARGAGVQENPSPAPPRDPPLVAEAWMEDGRSESIIAWGPDAEGAWRVRPAGYRAALRLPGSYVDSVRAGIDRLGSQ